MAYIYKQILIIISFILFVILFSSNSAAQDIYEFKSDKKTYHIVKDKKTWEESALDATVKGGYLVEIDDEKEQELIRKAIFEGAMISLNYTTVNDGGGIAYIWIGGTDKLEEGKWIWDGNNDSEGKNFWTGQGLGGSADGKEVNGSYQNWGGKKMGSPMEPDNFNNNQDACAIALEPWPKNMGIMGTTAEWNDINITNLLYFIVEFDFADFPDKAASPSGDTLICEVSEISNYNTSGAENAVSYEWVITEGAGEIESNGLNAVVKWNPMFRGLAEISVRGVNPLGIGDYSDPTLVNVVSLPEKPNKPAGLTKLCKDPKISDISIDEMEGVNSYSWKIVPENAGIIEPKEFYATIDWNDDYVGNAEISFAGVNDCGIGEYSDPLVVSINDIPNTPGMPTGSIEVNINTENSEYTVEETEFTDLYIWELNPEEAGTISGETNKAIVNWSNGWTGTAVITVISVNDCGQSEVSPGLEISVIDPTSIFDLLEDEGLNVYPVPADSEVIIEVNNSIFGNSDVMIYNSYGELVGKIELQGTYSKSINQFKADVSNLESGVYYLVIETPDHNLLKRIVIIR